jgi:signal transduction histidine kinase
VDPFAVFPVVLPGFALLTMLELARTSIAAVYGGQRGAWIVGIGILALVAGVAYDSLLDLQLIYPVAGINNGYYYGMTAMEVSMGVFLAIVFAATNRDLEQKLGEVEQLSERMIEQEKNAHAREIERARLEAENQRKALELEKAKQLRESYDALEKAHEELKSTQASLIHSEKMASLGRLAAGIAHEIKNPLNFINNFATISAEMLAELRSSIGSGLPGSESDREEILKTLAENSRKIAEHGRKADGVVKSLMQHAGSASGRRESVDLNKTIDDWITLSYRSFRSLHDNVEIQIGRDLDPAVGHQEIVPETFGRALMNILDNAFEAATSRLDDSQHVPVVTVSTTRLDDAVLIRVRDNGPGVPADLREQIFEPFFTTKPTGSGTGLGLSLAHEVIVDGHGGSIGLEELGVETGFFLTIPAAERGRSDDLGSSWPESF